MNSNEQRESSPETYIFGDKISTFKLYEYYGRKFWLLKKRMGTVQPTLISIKLGKQLPAKQ